MPTRTERPPAAPRPAPAEEMRRRIDAELTAVTAQLPPAPPAAERGIGTTTFDLPGSEDGTVTVLLSRENMQQAPAQALLRIFSRDGRKYLGVVTAGPFAEPDGLRGDSTILTSVATSGASYLPHFHGRVQVQVLGEELADGTLVPPRLRPLPHSPVRRLTDAETARALHADGDLRLGLALGYDNVAIAVPSGSKAVLPRHTAILGTTGGGKSTTVAGLVRNAQAAGMAVVLLDVEGEYTRLHEPTDDRRMLAALADRGLAPEGLPAQRMSLYHLTGRDTANPDHPNRKAFALQFARLSPYAVIEILDLNEPQQERFLKAYEIARELLRELNVFPVKGNAEQERLALEIDDFERGYPRLSLSLLLDVLGACLEHVSKPPREKSRKKGDDEECDEEAPAFQPYNDLFRTPAGRDALRRRVHATQLPGHPVSWRAVLGRLWRLHRLRVFDAPSGELLRYREFLRPGHVSVVDLSDTALSELNNLVIADLLQGLQEAQDQAYEAFEKSAGAGPPPRVLIIIEEAHEFLAAERIEKMDILFRQVARLAKRGRKRWLGLVFVTQLPQHLPRQVLALVNSFILHKITDPMVLGALRKSVSGVDEGLWTRLSGLAPGQAIVSFPHLARPLLASIDPAPCRLRLVD